jgi:hypothetical protein
MKTTLNFKKDGTTVHTHNLLFPTITSENAPEKQMFEIELNNIMVSDATDVQFINAIKTDFQFDDTDQMLHVVKTHKDEKSETVIVRQMYVASDKKDFMAPIPNIDEYNIKYRNVVYPNGQLNEIPITVNVEPWMQTVSNTNVMRVSEQIENKLIKELNMDKLNRVVQIINNIKKYGRNDIRRKY